MVEVPKDKPTKMPQTNFDALMTRYLENKVTDEEKAKIEAWLKLLESQRTDDFEMTDEEEEVLFQKIKSRNISEVQTFIPDSLKKARRTRWTWRIAAGLFILVFAGTLAWKIMPVSDNQQSIAGEIHKVILNDGTIVWLHGESSINYFEKPEGRFAELNGEGLFEVTKNPDHPFMISYNEVTIRVVGTSFNLKTGDSVELKVLTGKVHISTTTDKTGIDVVPNEKAVYTTAAGITKYSLTPEEVVTVTAHTEYSMDFSNATFREVADHLEEKFDVTITFDNKEMESCHLKMDITDYSLEGSLEMITSILNVTYQKKNNMISFAGTGCK